MFVDKDFCTIPTEEKVVFVCVCVCLCVWPVSLYICVECIHISTFTCVEVQMHLEVYSWRLTSFSIVLHSIFWEGLMLNPEFTDLGLPPEFSVYKWPHFLASLLCGFWGSKLWSSYLPSKHFLQVNHPQGSIFMLKQAHRSRHDETTKGDKANWKRQGERSERKIRSLNR